MKTYQNIFFQTILLSLVNSLFFYFAFAEQGDLQGEHSSEPKKSIEASSVSTREQGKRKVELRPMYAVEDGVSVYQDKNFDSPVIFYLKKDKKILATKKVYKGPNEFGSFYKVKLPSGQIGFVADIDLYFKSKEGNKVPSVSPAEEKSKSNDQSLESEQTAQLEMANGQRKSLYYSTFWGPIGSYVNFSETVGGQSLSSGLIGLGLQWVGSQTWLEGVPLSTTLTYLHGAPDYYKRVASNTASGFGLSLESVFLLPLTEKENWGIYYGGGVSLTYTFYNLKVYDTSLSRDLQHESEELRAGLVLEASGVVRFSKKVALRLSGHYIYDSDPFHSFSSSVLFSY